MLKIERDIAYDIMGEQIERTQEQILAEADQETLIEKSDITAIGVAVPEVLQTEGDEPVQEFGHGDEQLKKSNKICICDISIAVIV